MSDNECILAEIIRSLGEGSSAFGDGDTARPHCEATWHHPGQCRWYATFRIVDTDLLCNVRGLIHFVYVDLAAWRWSMADPSFVLSDVGPSVYKQAMRDMEQLKIEDSKVERIG